MTHNGDTDFLGLTAKVVSAHVGHNHVTAAALPEMIQSVYHSLAKAGTVEPAPIPQTPAVSINRSVFPDYIICLEDGKKLKMLKRHLQASYGMTTEQYRQRWRLPASYPLVGQNAGALYEHSLRRKRTGCYGVWSSTTRPSTPAG